MRFTKKRRFPFERTSRKDAAAVRRQRLDRDKLPLFAAEIAEAQPTIDEVMTARERSWNESQVEERKRTAAHWIEVRARIRSLPDRERALFLDFWNNHRWFPANPSYLATVLHAYQKGDFVEHNGKLVAASTLKYEQKLDARVAEATDDELAAIIQREPNMALVKRAREERERRFNAQTE